MLPFIYQVDHTLWIKLLRSKNEITKADVYIQKERFENFWFFWRNCFYAFPVHKYYKVQVFFRELKIF